MFLFFFKKGWFGWVKKTVVVRKARLGGVEAVVVLLGQGAGDGDGLAHVDQADEHRQQDLQQS